MLRGQLQEFLVIPEQRFQYPREDAQGTTQRSGNKRGGSDVSIPPRRCSGDNGPFAGNDRIAEFQFPREDAQGTTKWIPGRRHIGCFNSPEKMLRGQLQDELHAQGKWFQFPREDAQGTTPCKPHWIHHRVSIPPRRCSGDNFNQADHFCL